MKYFYLTCFAIAILSCADSDKFLTEKEFQDLPKKEVSGDQICIPQTEMWVCHNPESPVHDQECSEQCYSAGENSKFCWYFQLSDCLDKTYSREWQEKYCPKLNSCE